MMSHDMSHDCRLVSERTVEENILRKAHQKKLLGDIAIEGGAFTTEFFKKVCMNLLNGNLRGGCCSYPC